MAEADVIRAISNVYHVSEAILRDFECDEDASRILEDIASKGKRIENNIRKYEHIYAIAGENLRILEDAAHDFDSLHRELREVHESASSKRNPGKYLGTLDMMKTLRSLRMKLERKDSNLMLLAMLGSVRMEHRANHANFVSAIDQIRTKYNDVREVIQTRMIEEGVQPEPLQREENGNGYMHLATGVCLYEKRFGVNNFTQAAQHFNTAINQGETKAYYFLGMLYKHGLGVEKNDDEAKKLFQQGTDAGDPAAVTQLGICYDEGIGVEKNTDQAIKYVERGAEAEDPLGMAVYSWSKLHGYNTCVNLPLAFRMSLKASEKGFGKDVLAYCYMEGIEVKRNPTKAVKLYREAVEDGRSWIANLPLAKCYEQGVGVEADLRTAAQLYKKGSKSLEWQRPYFHAYYGMCLIRGRGIEEDLIRGWDEIEKSVHANNATGWYAKGECYRFGYGVEQNLHNALTNYKRATQAKSGMDGKINAQFALGCMYEIGEGNLAINQRSAFDHFMYAANRMHQEAQWKVASFLETGCTGVNRDLKRAVHYYRLAANSGHKQAQYKASEFYMKGIGVARDFYTAEQILRPAAERGDWKARRRIRRIQAQLFLRRESPVRSRLGDEMSDFNQDIIPESENFLFLY